MYNEKLSLDKLCEQQDVMHIFVYWIKNKKLWDWFNSCKISSNLHSNKTHIQLYVCKYLYWQKKLYATFPQTSLKNMVHPVGSLAEHFLKYIFVSKKKLTMTVKSLGLAEKTGSVG